jgi:branched-chain amino acid transport system permease protein
MTLVGGLGTLSGPLVGSAVVVLLENKIGEFGHLLARIDHRLVQHAGRIGHHGHGPDLRDLRARVPARIMGEIIAFIDRRRGTAKG